MDSQAGGNPYAAPTASVRFIPGQEDSNFIPDGRSVPMGNGFAWISAAWQLFRRQPGTWTGFAVAYFVIAVGLSLLYALPIVGPIMYLFTMFLPVLFAAGVVHSCDLLRREGKFAFADLFIALKRKTFSLLLANLICLIALFFLLMVVTFGSIFLATANLPSLLATDTPIAEKILLSTLPIFFIVSFLYVMAIWFAPALIIMHNFTPFNAVKTSFLACLKSIPAGIIFFLVLGVLIFISALPLLLGLLVTIPMAFVCYYTTYRDVFFDVD